MGGNNPLSSHCQAEGAPGQRDTPNPWSGRYTQYLVSALASTPVSDPTHTHLLKRPSFIIKKRGERKGLWLFCSWSLFKTLVNYIDSLVGRRSCLLFCYVIAMNWCWIKLLKAWDMQNRDMLACGLWSCLPDAASPPGGMEFRCFLGGIYARA